MAVESIVQHTPGPWHVGGEHEADLAPLSIWAPGFSVATLMNIGHEADAHLIAAAPELLAALEEFVNPVGHDGRCVMRNGGCLLERELVEARQQRAVALIAKARGQQ